MVEWSCLGRVKSKQGGEPYENEKRRGGCLVHRGTRKKKKIKRAEMGKMLG